MNKHIHIFPAGAIMLALLALSSCAGRKSAEIPASEPAASQAATEAIVGLELGNKAPELAFPSPDGKTINLSDYRGKLVLIDFWASWCMPCRIENPNLVKVYDTYKNKKFKGGEGFTIYSVSLDLKKEAWITAIKDDGLSWEAHVSDLKGWNAVPAAMYQVMSIPANLLIDGQGIILAKNLRADALESTVKGLLE